MINRERKKRESGERSKGRGMRNNQRKKKEIDRKEKKAEIRNRKVLLPNVVYNHKNKNYIKELEIKQTSTFL